MLKKLLVGRTLGEEREKRKLNVDFSGERRKDRTDPDSGRTQPVNPSTSAQSIKAGNACLGQPNLQ